MSTRNETIVVIAIILVILIILWRSILTPRTIEKIPEPPIAKEEVPKNNYNLYGCVDKEGNKIDCMKD